MTSWRTRAAAACIVGGLAAPVLGADEPLMVVDWGTIPLPGGTEVVADEGGSSVLLIPAAPQPEEIHIATIAPEITAEAWAVLGRIRYEDVRGPGYLEMWSVFPGGARYFSRTVAESGPLAGLNGTSRWRDFALPFYGTPEAPAPIRLEINLVVGEHGPIEMGPLRVVGMSPETPIGDLLAGGWWNSRTSGWIGGVGGLLVGLLGAFIGWAAARGNCPGVAVVCAWALVGVGAAALAIGAAALSLGQPFSVWFVPCLLGSVAIAGGVAILPTIRRRREDTEDRLLRAQEISGR